MALYHGSTVYFGNQNQFQVQLDATVHAPSNQNYVDVTYSYLLWTRYSRYDKYNNMNWSDHWGSGATRMNISHGRQGGTTRIVGPVTQRVGTDYTGSRSVRFQLSAHLGNEVAGGASSTLDVTLNIPNRTARAPDAPGVIADMITQTSARFVTVAPGFNGGAPINGYRIFVLDRKQMPNGPTGLVGSSTTSPFTLSSLFPNRTYWYTAQARNVAGWGAFTPLKSFKTLPGVSVRANGAWRLAVPFVKVNGVWKEAQVFVKNNSKWK